MSDDEYEVSNFALECARDGLADCLGIHPDFLEDNDVDVKCMAWHIDEAVKVSTNEVERLSGDIDRMLNAINAVGLTPEQKDFIAAHLEKSRPC